MEESTMKHRTKFTKTAAFTLIFALVLSLFPTAVLAENVSVISAEASVQTTNDGRLSNYNASEEGYVWNEESKVLTITQSTELQPIRIVHGNNTQLQQKKL